MNERRGKWKLCRKRDQATSSFFYCSCSSPSVRSPQIKNPIGMFIPIFLAVIPLPLRSLPTITRCVEMRRLSEREGGETQAQVCHPRPAPLPTSCLPRIVISYSRSRFPSPPSCSHRSGEERDTLFNSAKDTAHTQPSSPK